MKLTVLNSNSNGNCYILTNGKETLVLEAGVSFRDIKIALNFSFENVVGCIVSHLHNDHSKSLYDLYNSGVSVYANAETLKHKAINLKAPNVNVIEAMSIYKIGNFKIKPFDVKHDVPTLGFYINHPDMGNLVFITDTYYVEHKFPNINHLLVECNYAEDIIEEKLKDKSYLRNRIFASHFNLRNCKEFLCANDLSKVNEIVLIHLSDSNSDEHRFVDEVSKLTGIPTYAAIPKLTLELSLADCPFN